VDFPRVLPSHWYDPERPVTRADCINGPRPCPWASCRHHLYLDVVPGRKGDNRVNLPHDDKELEEIPETCSLDVADRQAITLEACGKLFNVTRERVRQIEARALRRLKAPAEHLRSCLEADTSGDHVTAEERATDGPWSDRQYVQGGGEGFMLRRR
jgi:hypothetical protein